MSIPKVHRQNLPVGKTNEAYITDFAIDMIRSRDPDRPFFQVCSYNGPHPPFMIPEPYFSMYDPADVPVPGNFGPNGSEHQVHTESYYRDLFNDHGRDFDLWRASYAVYWGFVTMIDGFVGQLLQVMDDEGLSEDTVILFTSDHGENLGAHGLWQKMVAFEESIRVPLILRPTGRLAGARSLTPASLVDIAPTLSELCGLPVRDDWPGRNLWEADWQNDQRPAQMAMHRPIGDWMKVTDWRMIKADGFKYVWHNDKYDELFDLRNDPGEINNLSRVEAYQQTLEGLQRELGDFLFDTKDPLFGAWQSSQHSSATSTGD